jgi:hypothetical protein
MPYKFKALTYWIIIANCLMMIGAGHAVAPFIFWELFTLISGDIYGENFCFGFGCSYNASLNVAALVSLAGQFMLLVSTGRESHWLRHISLGILLFGFAFLCHNLFSDGLTQFTFFTGIPFLAFTIRLIYLLRMQVPDEQIEK